MFCSGSSSEKLRILAPFFSTWCTTLYYPGVVSICIDFLENADLLKTAIRCMGIRGKGDRWVMATPPIPKKLRGELNFEVHQMD